MNTPDIEPTRTATAPEPEQAAHSPQQQTGKNRPWKLSAATKAFIAQMAENLRTHDLENPKGRLRRQP